MKTCSKCKKQQSLDSFYKVIKSKDGLDSWCKKCKYNAHRKYHKKRFAIDKEYREKNAATSRKYYIDNIQKHKKYSASYQKENRDKINNYQNRKNWEKKPDSILNNALSKLLTFMTEEEIISKCIQLLQTIKTQLQ